MSGSRIFRSLPTPSAGQTVRISGAHGCACGIAIADLVASTRAPTLVVTPTILAAEQLCAELKVFVTECPVRILPDWETLPYDHFSPYQDIVSDRLSVLSALTTWETGIVVVSISTAIQRLVNRKWLVGNSISLAQDSNLERDSFLLRLADAGYRAGSEVTEHGEYAVRGSIIDLFPMGHDRPLRLELFDDEIESIKEFDPETQRTTQEVSQIEILPAREVPLTRVDRNHFQRRWFERFPESESNVDLLNDVMQGLIPAGIEYYLPLFFESLDTIFDYLPKGALVVDVENVVEEIDGQWDVISDRHDQLCHDVSRPILAPAELYIDRAEYEERLQNLRAVSLSALSLGNEDAALPVATATQIPIDVRAETPLKLIETHVEKNAGRVLFVVESNGRRETLLDLFRASPITPNVYSEWVEVAREIDTPTGVPSILVAPIASGCEVRDPSLSIVTENQLFGERAQQRRRRRRTKIDQDAIIRNLVELEVGAPIVHELHGIGRYQGLTLLDVGDTEAEFIELEYADEDRLYVPVASLHLLSRYAGLDPERVPLHKLGSGQWEKARRKAQEKIRDVAAELLEVYAQRNARSGYVYEVAPDASLAFAESFPFEETPDQESAIEAVFTDLASSKPMDRLICGDAGFGKTEVAMRAAFVACENGKQVAVLVPTTLLAQQHYQTFSDRFADWPVKVESLSRFRSTAESQQVIEGLATGTIDIVVGTHKLLSEAIKFKRLGLLIIDEEHRFGVRQKEKIKAVKSDVDVLTLTATPIPRTLNLALAGTRDISIIATPPSRRLSVKTFVREWRDDLISEAIFREIARGGQVFFLHNDIESIEETKNKLEALVPEARIRVAHGQLREKDLERIMLDFYQRRFNVLVCTTIIENGIDIPTANTIIINRADRFGLAQLYQLRGRVGRSHHRAYAFLIIPHVKALTADAKKRLEAIESLEELGIGFTLATHDLEIRGAGEILGEGQSGHVQEIGFGLYTELLNRAVNALKNGQEPNLERPLSSVSEVELRVPALFPDDYIPDVRNRLILYKRVASAAEYEELQDLREEVIDRFGDLPTAAVNLFRLARLKQRISTFGIEKIDLGKSGGRILFEKEADLDPEPLMKLMLESPDEYKFDGPDKIRIRKDLLTPQDRFSEIESFVDSLSKTN